MSLELSLGRHRIMRRNSAVAVILGVVLAVGIPAAAHADPVTVYSSPTGLDYSIQITQDGLYFNSMTLSLTNLGTQTTTYGLEADLETQGVMQDVWTLPVIGSLAEVTLAPGETAQQAVPPWPGTTLEFVTNLDGTPVPLGQYTVPGDHVRTVFGGDNDNPTLEMGPEVTWSTDPVVTGAGLGVTATGLAPGAVEVYLDAGNGGGLDWVGDDLATIMGDPVYDLGSGVVAPDGTLSLDGVVPADTPAGAYTFDFVQNGVAAPYLSSSTVDVDGGLPTQLATPSVSITGAAKVGGTLAATVSGADASLHYHYQWLAGGTAIDGATSASYVPTDAQVGSSISVSVVAWGSGIAPSDPGTSAATRVIPVAKTFASTSQPTISGTPTVGQKLTVSVPAWSPTTGFSYQWEVNGERVGTDAKTYTLAPADLGGTVTVVATSTKAGYDPQSVSSDPTEAVAAGQIQPPAVKPIVAGVEKVGGLMTIKLGNWMPDPDFTYQWLIGGVAVPDATNSTLTIPAAVGGVSTIGMLVSAMVTATSPGYDSLAVTTPTDPKAITKAAKTT